MEMFSVNEKQTIPHLSDINSVYDWLLSMDLSKASDLEYDAWINMASHCYFMNDMNLGGFHAKSLQKVLDLAELNNIKVPDTTHCKILNMVEKMKKTKVITDMRADIIE